MSDQMIRNMDLTYSVRMIRLLKNHSQSGLLTSWGSLMDKAK